MRFKWPKRCSASLVAAIAFLAAGSSHALTVIPPAPYAAIAQAGGGTAVYYPSTSIVGTYYLAPAFAGTQIDLTQPASQVSLYITSGDGTKFLWVLENASTTPVPVTLASCNFAGCTDAARKYTQSGDLNIQLSVSAMCASGTTVPGCTAGNVFNTAGAITGVQLTLVESAATTFGGITAAEITAGTKIAIIPEVSGPALLSCPGSPGYYPGDQSVVVSFAALTAQANNGSSPSFPTLWAYALAGGLTPGSYNSATIQVSVPAGSGEQEIGGFKNSTQTDQHPYGLDFGVQDSAGLIRFCGDDPATQGMPYPIPDAYSTDIQGFLRESNCFVATASFRSGHAPAVMMLREFRDAILSRTELGRSFIGWYYENGPKAADWLIEHPTFRTLALALLLPLEALAWVALHPSVLWLPLAALILFLGFFFRRSLPFLVIAVAVGSSHFVPSARATDQPYIDSLISQLPPDAFPETKDRPDPYIQAQKRKLAPEERTDGYAERLRKDLPADDGSEGYTRRIQRTLSPDHGSAIEDYRKGRKLRADKGSPVSDSAFGFKLAATANRTYTAGSNQDVAYEQVYGNQWIPDFTLHYEKRVFSATSLLHNLGLYGSIGSSFTKAQGIFAYTSPVFEGQRAKTTFQFIMIPVDVGLIYRMNWGLIYPFFGAGPSAIGMIERRHDEQPGNRGYSLGYWFTGGVGFGLDFLSSRSSWDQYETAGIKHSYLTIDYTYLSAGGLVDLTVDGIGVGFTFEL